MPVITSPFFGVPEVFVPEDKFEALDTALQMMYNIRLEVGHAKPWYYLQGPDQIIDNQKKVINIINEAVRAYDI